MTEEAKNKRSRRRFLADMLFVGGGVTAAALLAKSQFLDDKPVQPVTGHTPPPIEPPPLAGAAVPEQNPTPCETPNTPLPGEPMPPEIEGEYVLPDPAHTKGDYVQPNPAPQPREPKLGGKPIAPKPQKGSE